MPIRPDGPSSRTTVRLVVGMALLAATWLATTTVLPGQTAPSLDLIIRGGTLVDGTGRPAFRSDVGIAGGRIVQIGELDSSAPAVIDAAGLTVAPGFIDVHTHADNLFETPSAENFVRMGVTAIVAGNCGSSAVDIAQAFGQIRASGASLNFATLVGHNSVRSEVMGTVRRAPTPAELDRMKMLVARAMSDGAVGFSTGLQYVPGTYAETAEIVELARTASARGGLYATHMRNEGTELERAVSEAIAIGEAASCPVEISHLKVDSPKRWGASEKALALIDQARARGIDVKADQYAYTAASSNLGIRLPSWVLEGGQDAINQRMDDPIVWQRIKDETIALFTERGFSDLSFAVVASHVAAPAYNGKSIKQVAELVTGSGSVEAQLEVVRSMMKKGGASMVYHLMSEDDIGRIMRHPHVSVASDSWVLVPGAGVPHPRGYGNNVRVLGRYVREQHVISLEEAVRKMTSLPADHFRLAGRGRLAAGYAADLVLFDAATVGDPATYDRPHQYPTGVKHVLVNGVLVVKDGNYTGARPGQVLRGPSGHARSRFPMLRLVYAPGRSLTARG